MTFRELLSDYYQLHPGEKILIDERPGLLADNHIYFSTEAMNLETIYMEQAVLAYYLLENGYRQMALPIKNMKEEWFTDYGNNRYLIYQVTERNLEINSTGRDLAMFHEVGSNYSFEPKAISSYGEWKRLWVDKLTLFEETINERSEEQQTHPLLFDVFPYIIGMSENAIQYLRETEEMETRFTEVDQGTIAFIRFHDQFNREVLWPDQLGYDHPARDISEYIRMIFLTGQSDHVLQEFLRDYQAIRPLSIFSWRLIYARLLFPIHLFDALEQCLNNRGEGIDTLRSMVNRQGNYEERLRNFFDKIGINKGETSLVEVDWL